jgi:F-type H+-transporting ATPase subunit b
VIDSMPSPLPRTEAPALSSEAVAAAETHAGTTAPGSEHHEEALLLGQGAEFYVYVSMTIFFVLAIILGKLPQRIAGALDDRIAGVKRQLDEAKALRTEAEALLADANARREAATLDAEAIVARARSEASELVAAAETNATLTIERRTAAAEAKIAAAERAAEAELRADVARRVTAAAASLIAANTDKKLAAKLTDDAIAGLERRLH